MKTKSFFFLLMLVVWMPRVVHGQAPKSFERLVELKNYMDAYLSKPPVKRYDDVTVPLEPRLIVDGEKIVSLDEVGSGIYLNPVPVSGASPDHPTPKERKYFVARIHPNLEALWQATSLHEVLIALCGNKNIEKCWSIVGGSIDQFEVNHSKSMTIIYDLRYAYTSKNDLKFLNVAFELLSTEHQTENRMVSVKKITSTYVRAAGLHPEMEADE